MTFAEILQEIINSNNITQKDIRLKCNLYSGLVSALVNDKQKPSYETLQKLAMGLNIDANILLGVKEVPKEKFLKIK